MCKVIGENIMPETTKTEGCHGYGMEIVDKICNDAKPTDQNGTIPMAKQPVIEYIKVIE